MKDFIKFMMLKDGQAGLVISLWLLLLNGLIVTSLNLLAFIY